MARPVLAAVLLMGILQWSPAHAAGEKPAAPQPFVYEFSYKVKWGHFDEFRELYKKNHLPLLREQMKRGEITALSVVFPINHANESARWDMRVVVTYRDAFAAHEDIMQKAWVKAFFPDQAKFKAEEQRRFEMLLEHTDVPVVIEDPASW
jgi:hypothetical protein